MAPLEPPPSRSSADFVLEGAQASASLSELGELSAAAEAAPELLELQWRAGMAHLRASLRGQLEQRDAAERYLERAWRLDPASEQVPAARVLARYLNMRSSMLDSSKLELQMQLYAELIAQAEREGEEAEVFKYRSFARAGRALARYDQGQTLAALRELRALERSMATRAKSHPEDIDSCAMAGNFELTFAGVIPVGAQRRLAAGVDYLETQQDHWDELSPRARSQAIAPNVRSVFGLLLAEGLLAHGDVEAAAARYEQLITLDDQPDTVPRRQLRALAEHRMSALEAYAGARELLPLWPAGVTGCVACHARETTLPTDELFLLPGVELDL